MRNHLLDLLASLYVAGTIVFTVSCLEGLTHCVSLTGSHCSCLFTLTVLVLRYVHTVLSLSPTLRSLSPHFALANCHCALFFGSLSLCPRSRLLRVLKAALLRVPPHACTGIMLPSTR